MIKLNDDTIFIGQIKQILKDFNLPLCRIGRTFPCANRHFIVKDSIFRWEINKDGQLEEIFCDKYNYGKPYANLTANFKIQNMIYDRATHRYLGKYLRFLRDYKGLNLMSMYNCFDSDYYEDKLSFDLNNKKIDFTSDNDLNFVYKVPISINELTIYTHSMSQVELCLTIDDDDRENKYVKEQLAKLTYIKKKYNKEFYYNPFDYLELSPITNNSIDIEKNYNEVIIKTSLKNYILQNLDKLCLLIKVPKSLKTSVVVLEGKYISKTNRATYYTYKPYNYKIAEISDLVNSTSLSDNLLMHVLEDDGDYKYLKQIDDSNSSTGLLDKDRLAKVSISTSYPIFSQLLSFENTSMNYVLGDRLIEYLTGNAITNLNEPYEIKRVQKVLDKIRYSNIQRDYNTVIKNAQKDLEDAVTSIELDDIISDNQNKLNKIKDDFKAEIIKYNNVINIKNNVDKDRFYGIWHYTDLQDLKNLQDAYNQSAREKGECDIDFYDLLGYVDKDFENRIKGDLDNADI